MCVCAEERREREREGGKYKITYVVYLYQGQWLDERGEPRKVNLTGRSAFVSIRGYLGKWSRFQARRKIVFIIPRIGLAAITRFRN